LGSLDKPNGCWHKKGGCLLKPSPPQASSGYSHGGAPLGKEKSGDGEVTVETRRKKEKKENEGMEQGKTSG